jgi:putative transposase
MPRIARVVAKGYPHHVTQRGNYRQPVFEEDDDYVQHLEWLQDYANKYSLKIWAYCLMANHVHFVCVPAKEDSLARTFGKRDKRLVGIFKRKRRWTNHKKHKKLFDDGKPMR